MDFTEITQKKMFKIQKEVTVEMKIVYQNLQTLKLQYQHIELQILSDIQSEDNLIISSFPKLFRRFCDFSCMYSIRIERHSLHSRYQLVDTYSHILQVPKQVYIASVCSIDVLWSQLIQLAQVASTSKLLEIQQNDLVFFKIIPSHF